MRIALAQINSVLGGIDTNINKIISLSQQAKEKNCELIVFPELAVLGYSPNDLLERPEIIQAQIKALKNLPKIKGLTGIAGAVTLNKSKTQKPYFNSAVIFSGKGNPVHKTLLPTYDIFDETRFFQSGDAKAHVQKINGKRVAILVCEDMWGWERAEHDNFLKKIAKPKCDVVISINASPFALSKRPRRMKMAKETAKIFKCPVVYVNMVGGQDELIFDGGSFAINAKGKLIAQSAYFAEELNVIDIQKDLGIIRAPTDTEAEILHGALVLGIRDFASKNRIQKLHLGLSGGIDSAVVLALAADAVGPQNVTAIAMPGPYSSPESLKLAQQLAKNIGCSFKTIDIIPGYEGLVSSFEKTFGALEFGLVHENAQARLRGFFLMMYSNLSGSLLLATGNKSEIATGYSTLYGDMCGGLMPIGDLLKRQVYALAKYYNSQHELIPNAIIERAPSAELRPNQKDQDTLPDYDLLDKSVDNVVSKMQAPKNTTEDWLLKKLAGSEFKRWQAPPVLRVTDHAFGRGRRMPISNAFYRK